MDDKILTEVEFKELVFSIEGAKDNRLTHAEVIISPKTCNKCGKFHTSAPSGSKIWDDTIGGVFFDCSCGSTIFVKWSEIKCLCLECFDTGTTKNGDAMTSNGCKECCPHNGGRDGGYCLDCDQHPLD